MAGNKLISGYIKKDHYLDQDSIFLSYKDKKKIFEVRISPFFGSNIYKFAYNDQDIFLCDYKLLKKRDWTGCFILWPFPNRIRDKKFEFEGEIYSLEGIKRKSGNYSLIHGLVDDQIWQIGEIKKNNRSIRASTFIDVKPGTKTYTYFPFESRLTLTFVLESSGLKITYTVENRTAKNMPFGFALHPYFSLLSGKNNAFIRLPAKSIMEADKGLLPTGKLIDVKTTNFNLNNPIPLSKLSLDHVFTNLNRSKMPYIDYTDKKLRIYLESSKDFTHAVLYTKEKSSFCFENQTGATDMINLHTKGIKDYDRALQKAAHLLILSPGNQHTGYVYYRIKEY